MEGSSAMSNGREGTEIDLSKITLRPLDLADIDDFMVWGTDEKVTVFCTWEPYASKEDALNFIKDVVVPHPWFKAICLDNRPIGELGYVLGSKYWGKGIASQAVKLVADTIFKEWTHLDRLEALVDVDNVGSQRLLEKVGFQREGVLRKYCMLKGRSRDMVIFSLLSTDWQT
ncbi:hypothetical protein D8674_017093 [Pyrus ussuriensis x Pyrus communis]|uniref:N-acetyltransferase domain-containing protein n=1 Tax=Pyrus ussuriensis x Pyrus communis TaxID=2448454 RepID=A0A5N5HFQ0_9ROSA|nr:hypothetical protein D8674_017093 [Pyrus ussuriensis x Pyrus communis]